MTRGVVLAFVALALVVPAAPAHADPWGRLPLYYADATDPAAGYPVDDQARRWSRNPFVYLVRVSECAGFDPCVTVTEVPDMGDTVSGDYDIAVGEIHLSARSRAFMATLGVRESRVYRAMIVCHELGHYVLTGSDADHSVPGCMSSSTTPRPTRAGRWMVRPRQEILSP